MISVIVPCYNVENYIDECIKSLENQTYKNFEVIFVNDGSKDGTLKKLKIACDKNLNFKLLDQQNGGVSVARNNGIQLAQGEFINFFDSDDMASPEFLQTLYKNIKEYNADYSACGCKMVKENYSFKKTQKFRKSKKVLIFNNAEEAIVQLYCRKLLTYSSCNKLFKTEIIKKMENYPNVFVSNITYGEDLDFNFRYLEKTENVAVFENKKLYFYRSRKGSYVHSKFNEKHLSVFVGHNQNIAKCEGNMPVAKTYIEGAKCVSCIEMLFRIWSAKYDNKEVIIQLFKDLKETLYGLKKSKKVGWYIRRTIPLSVPILKLLFRKYLKQNKKTAKA